MQLIKKTPEKTINKVVDIPTDLILPNPSQPRVIFNDYELSQLAVSIHENGILQPLTVRRNGQAFELVSGERRLRAAKLVKLMAVPCIIIDTNVKESAILAIMENIQRSDLNFIEEAFAIRNLIEYYEMTQEEAAQKLGLAQSTIANKLRLLKLTDKEKAAVIRHNLNERQARALLKLENEKRLDAIEKIATANMNSAQTDRYVDDLIKGKCKPLKRTWSYKEASLYIRTFNHTIESMKNAGIKCDAESVKTDEYIEYKVRIALS